MRLDGETIVFEKPQDRIDMEEALLRVINTWEQAPRGIRLIYYQLIAKRAAIDAQTHADLERNINAQSDAQTHRGTIGGQEAPGSETKAAGGK